MKIWKSIAENNPAERKALSREGLFQFSFAYLLAALAVLIVASPFVEQWKSGSLINSVLFSLTMLLALLAIGGSRSRLVWGILLLAPALVGKWVNYWQPDLMPPAVFLGAAMLFMGYVVLNFLRHIIRAPRVTSEILCAAMANYLMLGLLWSFAYTMLASVVPDAFVFNTGPASSHVMSGFNSVYFSFATISTLGYGDIAPISGGARMLAIAESVVGMFYVTMLIAMLVSLYITEGKSSS